MGEIENASAMIITTQHHNIEQLFAIVQLTTESPPILLTELLPENLNSYTTRLKSKLPVTKQLDLCHDMAKGLQFLHAVGLVHNNIHGANVLISHDERAKIADFICPLMYSLNENTTSQNRAYVSPESIRDEYLVSKQSDIYSLGVLCLQVITQCSPMPNRDTGVPEPQRWKEQLHQTKGHQLLPLIVRCLNLAVARPDIDYICTKIEETKQGSHSVMPDMLHHTKVSVYHVLKHTFMSKLCYVARNMYVN